LALVPKPDADTRHLLEVIAGAALITIGLLLWLQRGKLRRRGMPQPSAKRKSSAILGATITAVELPTAFPYFAVIAAIVGSGLGPLRQLFLLVLFNVCFVLPLIGIWATLTFAGDRADRLLAIGRDFLERHWPTVLAILLFTAGVFVTVLGITGYTIHSRGRIGRFSRGLQNTLHLHP
jgi:cytochrome c biogenesis protein CcdA